MKLVLHINFVKDRNQCSLRRIANLLEVAVVGRGDEMNYRAENYIKHHFR